MKSKAIGLALGTVLGVASFSVLAQSWTVPAQNARCPSKWGAGDERGSANHMKPASVMTPRS